MSLLPKRILSRLGLADHALGPKVARSSATVFLLIIASAALGLLSQITLTRSLGVSQYGIYSVAVSWSLVIAAPTMVGLDGSIIRFASEYSERDQSTQLRRFAEFVALIQLAAIVVAGAIVLFSPVGDAALGPMKHGNAIWIAFYVASTAFLGSFSSFFTALRRYTFSQFYQNLLRPTLLIACVLVWVLMVPRTLDAAFALKLTALTSVVALLPLLLHLTIVLSQSSSDRTARIEPRRWVAFSGWVQVGNICNQAAVHLPVLLIGALASPIQAGYFAIAARLSSLVTMGLSAVAFAISPMISSAYTRQDQEEIGRLARIAARLGTAISVLAVAVLAFGGASLMGVFGEGFSHAYLPLMVLLVGALFNAFSGVNAVLLAMTDQPRFAVEALVAGAVINVVIGYLLIPAHGALGAAAGATIGAVVGNAMMVIRIRRTIGIDSTAIGLAPKAVEPHLTR